MYFDAVTDRRLTYGERITYLTLASTIEGDSDVMPSIDDLCKLLGCKRTQASKFIGGLTRKGFIKRQSRFGLPAITQIVDPKDVDTAIQATTKDGRKEELDD